MPAPDGFPPGELVKADGSLDLTTRHVGTVDLRGWDIRLDPQRGPVLAPNAPSSAGWSALGSGVNDKVFALAISGSNVYIGGDFTQVCGVPTCDSGNFAVNHIAKWNGSDWSALGNGLNDSVYAITTNGTDVYAGGKFIQICGPSICASGRMTANHVAMWDGSGWSQLANGVDNTVYALAASGSDVYAGGSFTQVCGVATCDSSNFTVNRIAKWNGSGWSALKSGVDNTVYALAVSGSDLYVGGIHRLLWLSVFHRQ